MIKLLSYLGALVRNNSGVSSKSFFLVSITIIGCFLLIVVGFVLLWEVIHNGTIQTDLNGLATFVAAIVGVFTSAGVTKAWSERSERDNERPTRE